MSIIMVGVISWTTLFMLTRKLLQNYSFEFCNRLVSTTHATIAVILASLTVQDWSCPLSPLNSDSSPKQVLHIFFITFESIYFIRTKINETIFSFM